MARLDWTNYVEIDRAYMRPADVANLRGDVTKAPEQLRWQPAISFDEMIHEMLEHDLQLEGLDSTKHLRPPARVTP